MSDAPERVWAFGHQNIGAITHGEWTDCIRHGGGDEYVRDDIHAAAIARAERAEAALDLLHSRASSLLFCYRHGNGLDGWHKAADGLEEALFKIAALKGGAA